ncbi:MAG: aminomethyltransferase [Crocinitomicaceae bacterium]|jgi:aminomethyltransferase
MINNNELKLAKDIQHVSQELLKSPFYPRQVVMNTAQAWSNWNGYASANYFKDAYLEYFLTRNTCGVYDVTAMCKYRFKGKDAEAMLNRMVTRDVTKHGINKVAYNVWCTDKGRIVDDGTIFRFAADDFRVYCAEPNLDWFMMAAEGFDDLTIVEESCQIAGLALQGPTSCALLRAIGLGAVETLKPMEIGHYPFPTIKPAGEIMISRTGFTGDLGYELWIENDLALMLWDKLFEKSHLYGLRPFGEESLNMARIEAGFILPEVDFHGALHTVLHRHDHSPYEMGLDWMVNLKKSHFSGKAALLKEQKNGPSCRLLKLDIEGEKPADNAILYSDDKGKHPIGYVTSALNSPATKANIGYGLVENKYLDGPIYAEIYYQKDLRWYQKFRLCHIKTKPFWAPERAKLTPPGDH